MEEDNIYEYEGTFYSESALREAYPDTFDDYVSEGILVKKESEEVIKDEIQQDTQEESLYEYEGVSYPESSLREAYPDTFDDYVEQGVLTKVDSLGKQMAVEDSAAARDMDLVSEDGSLEFPREAKKPKYIVDGKEVNRAYLNDNLYKSDFVDKLQEGTVDVEIFNDTKLEELLKRQAESGSQWGDKIEAFNSGLSTLASGVVGAPGFIVDVFEEITGVEADIDAIDYLDELSEDLSKKAEELNNQQRAYKDDFIGSISEGNILDAVNIGFNTVANSAPIMVAAGLTGGAGGVAGALTSAATMSAIMIPAEYASTKIAEDEKIKELSDGDKLTRAFFRGGAEGVFEGLMGPVGARSFSLFKDGVKNLVKTTAKESGAEAAKEVAEGMGKKTALEVFKTFGISTAGEAGSEALTALSQDLTDDYLGIQDLSVEEYMRNAAEAGALGVFMGGVTTGALGGAGQVMSYLPLRNQKVYQGAKTEVREKQESGEINNEEAKQMDDAIESAKVALDKTDPSLSEENQERVAKLIDERERIKLEIEGLDENQVPVQDKKNRIDEINKEISEIGIEKPSTEEEAGVPPTPEEPASAEAVPAEEEAKEEIKLSDSELSTESVYNKNVEEDNEDFIKGSNEFKDKAVNYDEGINDPKFIEENTVKEEVDVNDIIPTQNKLFKKSLNNKSTESPILIKVGNKYYVEDGHHRIADKIMSGGGKLNATVYNSTPLETAPAEEQEATGQEVEKVAKIAGVKAKNIRGLYDINRKMFGQNRVKSLASAVVMDRAIGQMAKREGVPKSEMYSKIQFEKGVKAPDGSLKQESLTFKSTAKEGLGNIQQKSATPEQWVKMIADKGGKGTIQELEWIGLNDFLQDYKKENKVKSIPKEVVEQYINDNQIEIVEVTKGKKVKPFKISEFEWALQDEDGNRVLPNDSFGTKELAEERIKGQNLGGDYGTKYSEYTLEGGENYREVLLTLPQEKPASKYKSSHWDETNIVAHLRLNERTLPNGERVLFIEEVQSDWAQEGKKKGFASDLFKGNFRAFVEKEKGLSLNEEQLLAEFNNNEGELKQEFLKRTDKLKTPDMPYKKTDQWVGMAMRRAMQMAAQEGFDRVAWVTGEQSADRYDLSKQIDAIDVEVKTGNSRYVNLKMPQGQNIVMTVDDNGGISESSSQFNDKNLEDVIGKELTKKVLDTPNNERVTLKGDGLKVGGEGMKAFYNSILPKVAKKEAQRFDPETFNKDYKAEVVEIEQKKKDDRYKKLIEKKKEFQDKADKSSGFVRDGYLEDVKRTQRSIDKEYKSSQQLSIPITPKMRMNLNGAVPLFQGEQGAMLAQDGNYIIYALTNPNVSTPLHELAHVYEHYLTDIERKQILNWAGKSKWDTSVSEKFARGFEKYLAEGKAPNSKLQKIFDKLKEWLTDIYNGIKGSDIDIELNDKMRSIYDQMLSEEQPKVAARKKSTKPKPKKKARSVASETTGLSPREAFKQGFTEFFDSIQRGKKEARQKAADNLKEKVNKIRESFKKRLQKEKDNKDARAAVVKEIRAIIKDSGISQFSKRTINKIMTNVKNANVNNMQRMVDEVMDVVNRDIDRKVRVARYKTLNAAIKKLSRLGALKELQKPLMEVLSINPDYLSKTALNFYDRVVINLANVEKKFDSRDSKEDLKNNAEEVIERFTYDNAKAQELAQKTINPNLDLTKTKGENLKQMLKDGLISDSDFELMTRFKDLIGKTSKEQLTMEGLEQKAKERREVAIEDFEAAMDEIPSSLPNLSRDDAEALRFANGLKIKDLDSLSTAEIKKLTRGLEMLQAGFITTNLVQSKLTVEAKRNTTDILINEVKERGKIDKAISSSKVFVQNLFRKRDKMITSIENRIKSTPLANIDQILNAGAKKFKSTRIYESIFRPVGAAFSRTEDFLNQVKKKLQVAESYLNLNGNKRYAQKAKVMIYQIQREFESNPKNNEVNEAVKWIEATLNDPDSNLSDVERKAIEKIRDEFTVNGQIDSKKILDSLTDKEKKYMAIIDEVYKSVEFMVAADAKMQGKPFVRRENYVHLPKVTKSGNSMSSDLNEISNSFTNPALKNKALTQRTGNAHAISFDPTFNVNGITKKAAISYYMYPAVKKAKITLAGVKQNAETDFQKETANALESVFDGIVKSQYAHLSSEKAFIEKALAFLGRAGYLAQLAGPVKAAVELSTNLTHALFVNPLGLISGFDTLSGNSREIMDAAINNLPTNQLNRLSGEGVKDSKEIDSRLINDSLNVFEQEEMTSEFRAKVNTIFKFAKKPASAIIKFNESLISRPDTIVARPLFVGVFNKSFENIAQEKPNWDKIANDQAYRDKFRDAINQATEDADTAVVDNAASNNPFDGIPKNVLDKDATPVKQALQMMDRYMTRFRTFEYYSALKGIQGLMGKGKLTPTQGAMLLAGTIARLSLYKMGIDMVFTLIFSMLGIDEEEDEIDLEKDLTKGVIGAIATLALGRSIGNISQMPINFGTEWLNKEYGEGITRSGEYNQYKDGMVFSKIPMEVKPQDNMAEKILTSSLGSYTPVVKTVTRAGKLATRAATSEGEDTRERNFGELTTRIPFEVAGNLGVVPGYKTLRKIYLKYLFGEVKDSNIRTKKVKKSTVKVSKSTRQSK